MTWPVLGAPPGMTALGRSVDFNYPSNIFAVAGSLVASAVAFAVELPDGFGGAISAAVAAGIGAFVAWAIARELDPDHPAAAAIALVIAGGAALVADPSLLAAAGALLAVRLAVGSTGSAPTRIDRLVLVAVAALLGAQVAAWPALLALVAATAVAVRGWLVPVLMAVGGAVSGVVFADAVAWAAPTGAEWLWQAITVSAGLVALAAGTAPSTTDDRGARPIALRSLRLARALALALLVTAFGLLGGGAAEATVPIAAAVVASAITTVWQVRNRAEA